MQKIKTFLILILVLLLSACSNNKTPKGIDEFKDIMKDNDYYIINSKEQFSEYDYILDSYIAIDSTKNFQIEFYKLSDIENAKAFFEFNKDIFDAERANTSLYTDVSLNNYDKYTLITDNSYKVLSRIDNTVIYIDVDKKYKKNINNILKKIGY